MGASNPPEPPAGAVPEAIVEHRQGLPLVWLIPVVALIIGAYLAYTTLSAKGPTIIITFKTAEGLEAGKTKIKHKNVEMGAVTQVLISEDLEKIIVAAEMKKEAAPHLKNDTRFWVVRPRLSTAGVSGLDTLVAGSYIEMDPGSGEPERQFVGLEEPPIIRSDVPGTEYRLRAQKLGSLSAGAPIYFRGIEAGQVYGYQLDAAGTEVTFDIFIKAPYDQLVREESYFWNASGIAVNLSADGLSVRTESLVSILTGGIAFDTPPEAARAKQADKGMTFPLFDDQESVKEASLVTSVPYLLHFDGSVRGLTPGAPVEFRGIQIGKVTDVRIEIDTKQQVIRIPVKILVQPDRLTLKGPRPTEEYGMIKDLIRRGLRAKLQSGNLITGALLVDLDFYPNEPPAELILGGVYPEIPTLPTDLEQIKRSVNQILEKVAALPLEGLVDDTRSMVKSVNQLVSNPELIETTKSLRRTADALEGTVKQADKTLVAAEGLIGPQSQVRYELVQALAELRDALRSIRVLADYLEQHPEALVHGKGGVKR
jgi:paraquat-inducible protein B